METLVIYKLGSMKFTTQNDLYWMVTESYPTQCIYLMILESHHPDTIVNLSFTITY